MCFLPFICFNKRPSKVEHQYRLVWPERRGIHFGMSDRGHDGSNVKAAGGSQAHPPLDPAEVKKMYDNMAGTYLQMMESDMKQPEVMKPMHDALTKMLSMALEISGRADTLRIADVGSGPGTNGEWLLQNAGRLLRGMKGGGEVSSVHVSNVDVSDEMVALATERCKSAIGEAETSPRLSTHSARDDMTSLRTFPDETYDALSNMCCVQHVDSEGMKRTVLAAKRVLKPGGVFLLQFWLGKDKQMPDFPSDVAFIGYKRETVVDVLLSVGDMKVEAESEHVYEEMNQKYLFVFVRKG